MSDVLESAWADIRRRNREVHRTVIAVAPGASGSACGSVAWASDPVLLVDTATLAEPPLDVFSWLLHQAAHSLADSRRKPTGASQGRYHDQHFRDAATDLGLAVREDPEPGLGWSHARITAETTARYTEAIDRLANALNGWTPPTPPARAGRAGRNGVAARCSCTPPRRIRVMESTFDLAPIRCEACGEEFRTS
jgi:hypothetical protein